MSRIDVDVIGSPAFSVVRDADGAFRYDGINAALTAASGFAKAVFVGSTPDDCMTPDAALAMNASYRRCFDGAATQEYEEHLAVPAGEKWYRTTLSPVLGPGGAVVQILGLCVDITERKLTELELRSVAFKDPLTGICNRRRFDRDLENAVVQANDTGRVFSVVLADVDRFKPINDTYGHAAGDVVLTAIAGRLAQGIRETDRLARIGGDEFAAILSAASEGAVAVAIDRMRRKLADPIRVAGIDLAVGVSLGAALWRPAMTTADMLAAADAEMYRQKLAIPA